MNLSKSIGGFFELEQRDGSFPHCDATLLRSGRNCFEYILRAHRPTQIHLPKFTCDAMLEPLRKLAVPYSLYSIDEHLEIRDEIAMSEGALIVYTNYFGIKDAYCRKLAGKYRGQLILDYSHAFYAEPSSISHTFYSPRKFFGLPDGGCLYTSRTLDDEIPASTSYDRVSHLMKRIDLGAEAAYADFVHNERSLSGAPIQQMSSLTRRLLDSIDYVATRETRLRNYSYLEEHLGASNGFSADEDESSCPMIYPFLSKDSTLRKKLIGQKIFVATYWPNVLNWCNEFELEYEFTEHLIPLPIDQRYGQLDMERIVRIVSEGSN